jgi:hypothetical protein
MKLLMSLSKSTNYQRTSEIRVDFAFFSSENLISVLVDELPQKYFRKILMV